MDLRAEYSLKSYIAFTLCDGSKFRFKNKFTDKPSFYECFVTRSFEDVPCKDLCPIYIDSTRFSNRCLTFLNCKYKFQPE